MNYDLDELYEQVVMEHSRHPRNMKKLDCANRTADGYNPFCGDKITLYLEVDDQDVIRDVGMEAAGCAIFKAAASMMTEAVKGKTIDEAREIFGAFRDLLTNTSNGEVDVDLLGDLEFLGGVVQFPVRIKCATLSWHTLNSVLNGQQASGQPVATE
jgi:nitrogen fixation NifU-like protein